MTARSDLSPSDVIRIEHLRREGRTWDQIGELFGCSPSTINDRYRRALGNPPRDRSRRHLRLVKPAPAPEPAPVNPDAIPSVTRWVPVSGPVVGCGRVAVSVAHVSLIDGPMPSRAGASS